MTRKNDFVSAAPLTTAIFAVNIALFVICAARSGSVTAFSGSVLMDLGASWHEGLWDGEWLRLIAPNFLHGGLLHIVCNSMALKSLGPSAEVYFGTPNFGTLYILTGVAGFCFSQMFGGHLAIGASAALFGLMGAQLAVAALRCPKLRYAWRNTEVRRLATWIALFFALCLSGIMGPIDNWGHLGGLLSGILLGGMFELWRTNHRLAGPGLLAVLVLIAGLICYDRWTFYSPSYHLYVAARAEEEDHNPELAGQEFQQALAWGKVWHEEAAVQFAIDAYRKEMWTLHSARVGGISYIMEVAKRYERYRSQESGGAS